MHPSEGSGYRTGHGAEFDSHGEKEPADCRFLAAPALVGGGWTGCPRLVVGAMETCGREHLAVPRHYRRIRSGRGEGAGVGARIDVAGVPVRPALEAHPAVRTASPPR